MSYHLVCVRSFQGYVHGQIVTDEHLVAELIRTRDVHFVKIDEMRSPARAEPSKPDAAPEPPAH